MNSEVRIVFSFNIFDSVWYNPSKLLFHVRELWRVILFGPKCQLVLIKGNINLIIWLIYVGRTSNNKVKGFSNVIAICSLLLDSKHQSVFQEFAVQNWRNISWSQGPQIKCCAHVHPPCSPFFNIFTENELLSHGHLTVFAQLRITATISTAFDFLMKAAFSIFCFSLNAFNLLALVHQWIEMLSLWKFKLHLFQLILTSTVSLTFGFLLCLHFLSHFIVLFILG